MNDLLLHHGNAIIEPLAATLFHSLWQGAIVAFVAGVVLRTISESQARLRYAVLCGALLTLVITVMATFMTLASMSGGPGTSAQMIAAAMPGSSLRSSSESPTAVFEAASAPAISLGETTVSGSPHALTVVLVCAWFAGVACMLLRFSLGCAALQQHRHGLREIAPRFASLAQHVQQQMHMRIRVRVATAVDGIVPHVIGWLRPTIVVPARALTGLSDEALCAIIAHELAHIRRLDHLVNMVQVIVESVLFYHPAVWWLSNRIRIEREYCCDDMAATVVGGASHYARALTSLELLRHQSQGLINPKTDVPRPQLALGASGGLLMNRIRRLVVSPARTRLPLWSVMSPLVGSMAIAAFGAAAVRTPAVQESDVASSSIRVVTRPAVEDDDARVVVEEAPPSRLLLGGRSLRGLVIRESPTRANPFAVRQEAPHDPLLRSSRHPRVEDGRLWKAADPLQAPLVAGSSQGIIWRNATPFELRSQPRPLAQDQLLQESTRWRVDPNLAPSGAVEPSRLTPLGAVKSKENPGVPGAQGIYRRAPKPDMQGRYKLTPQQEAQGRYTLIPQDAPEPDVPKYTELKLVPRQEAQGRYTLIPQDAPEPDVPRYTELKLVPGAEPGTYKIAPRIVEARGARVQHGVRSDGGDGVIYELRCDELRLDNLRLVPSGSGGKIILRGTQGGDVVEVHVVGGGGTLGLRSQQTERVPRLNDLPILGDMFQKAPEAPPLELRAPRPRLELMPTPERVPAPPHMRLPEEPAAVPPPPAPGMEPGSSGPKPGLMPGPSGPAGLAPKGVGPRPPKPAGPPAAGPTPPKKRPTERE